MQRQKLLKMISELFQYYLEHQESLVKQYDGKYIVLTKDGIMGAYDTIHEGYDSALSRFGKGNFMLQLCTSGDGAYSQRYATTRVSF